MVSLGSLFTREDMAAFLANLPQERDEPLLVDIYELYQEILARYQARLHSDERVWEAEIPVNQAADALAEHNATYGEYLHCTGEFATEDPAVCRARIELEERLDDVLTPYAEALATVTNEMDEAGLLPLMEDLRGRQTEAAELLAMGLVDMVIGMIPIAGEAHIARALGSAFTRVASSKVGRAVTRVVETVRGAGRAALNRVRSVTDEAVERVWRTRSNNFYEPRAWRQNYEDFYNGNITSTTIPPYSAPNVRLAGQRHPETGIVFDTRGFPIFDDVALYDTRLNITEFRSVSYRSQMRMATRDLRSQIENNPQLRSRFSPDQLQAIQSGQANIPRLTWHHHQDSGRMQLVDRDIHNRTGHVGGEAISGGL
jgi:hypothetical protein